jgi:hypothetical protein
MHARSSRGRNALENIYVPTCIISKKCCHSIRLHEDMLNDKICKKHEFQLINLEIKEENNPYLNYI